MRIHVFVIAAVLGACGPRLAQAVVSCRAALASLTVEQIFADNEANAAFVLGLERVARFSLQRSPTSKELQQIIENLFQSPRAEDAARAIVGLELWIDDHYEYHRRRLVEYTTDQIEDWGIIPRALRAPRTNTATGIVRNVKLPAFRGRLKFAHPENMDDYTHSVGDFARGYDSGNGPH